MNEYDDNEGDEHDDDSDASEKVYPWSQASQAVSQCAAKHSDTCSF